MANQPQYDGPTDPLTELGGGMVQLHELFVEISNAGWNPSQAMQVFLSILNEQMRAARPCPHCGRVRDE